MLILPPCHVHCESCHLPGVIVLLSINWFISVHSGTHPESAVPWLVEAARSGLDASSPGTRREASAPKKLPDSQATLRIHCFPGLTFAQCHVGRGPGIRGPEGGLIYGRRESEPGLHHEEGQTEDPNILVSAPFACGR